ncbi:hypothetical protein TUBRATIS_29670 [Tubulinosema ratisbonensis]|uniref:Uncharacterized protein n=1 Tax=Tubulinosema ratisbonensis TaxID=291195 RepID=A0A437AHH3_9MICR|nr:hypothetical protein TUBRATIS_29670 [Tubulinosema ratisbonensis]
MLHKTIFIISLVFLCALLVLFLFKKLIQKKTSLEDLRNSISECLKIFSYENFIDEKGMPLNFLICRHILSEDQTNLKEMKEIILTSSLRNTSNNIGDILRKLIECVKSEQCNYKGLDITIDLSSFPEYVFNHPILEAFYLTYKLKSEKTRDPCYYLTLPLFDFKTNFKETLKIFKEKNNQTFSLDKDFGDNGIIYPDNFLMVFKNPIILKKIFLKDNKKLIIDDTNTYKLTFIGINLENECKVFKLKEIEEIQDVLNIGFVIFEI